MFIAKRNLPRRTILKGLGTAMALPLLDAMAPALSALAVGKPVRRAGFVYIPNGAALDYWTPTGDGSAFQFSPTLKPLESFRDRINVLTGLGHTAAESQNDGAGEHARSSATWLDGVRANKTGEVRAGTTIDQYIAEQIGKDTVLPSLEVGLDSVEFAGDCDAGYSCSYMNTISWKTPTLPLPMENNPRAVFERLFGDGTSAAQRRLESAKDQSILDSILSDVAGLSRTLGAGDRTRLSEYTDSVRDVEKRIHLAETRNAIDPTRLPEIPVGIPETFEEHAKLMYDLIAISYQADLTRVASFLLSRETNQRTYENIGVPEPHHSISHHMGNPATIAKLAKINEYHVKLFAYFLEKLRTTPDGDGNLLDHSLILYGGGMADPQSHSHFPIPLLIAGGASGSLKGGRHLTYPERTSMCHLLLSVLEKFDAPIEEFENSTGERQTLANL